MLKTEDVEDIKSILINGAKWSVDAFVDENMHSIAEWLEAPSEPLYSKSELELLGGEIRIKTDDLIALIKATGEAVKDKYLRRTVTAVIDQVVKALVAEVIELEYNKPVDKTE